MEDVERAKELIKEIRRNKHVDDPGGENETAVDLTNALKMCVPTLSMSNLTDTGTGFRKSCTANRPISSWNSYRMLTTTAMTAW